MTDNQYIEKLAEKGFTQGQVNQLLKIYLYTKELVPAFDLSSIRLSIDENKLRNFAEALKKKKVLKSYLSDLQQAIDRGIDVSDYISDIYDKQCLIFLINSELRGLDVTLLKNPRFSFSQMRILSEAIEAKIDISKIANPHYEENVLSVLIKASKMNIDLSKYVDISKFDGQQLRVIFDAVAWNDANPDHLVNITTIANREYSYIKMEAIFTAMQFDKDYSLLLEKGRSDKNIASMAYLMREGKDPMYSADEKLSEEQLEIIEKALTDRSYNDTFDYSKILDSKYNWAIMSTFVGLVKDDRTNYLEYLLDKDYSFEKIHELICALDKNININKLIDIDDIQELHFTRRMLELNKTEYLDKSIPFKERLDKFIKGNTREELEPDPIELSTPKYTIECNNLQNQYFMTKDSVVEICYDDEPLDEPDDSFVRINDNSYIEEFTTKYRTEISDTIKNFFIFGFDEERQNIYTYDLKNECKIDDDANSAYDSEIIEAYALDENEFYGDFIEDAINYLVEENCEYYMPPFEKPEELEEYGGPRISDFVIIKEVRIDYEDLLLTITEDDVKREYGDTSPESFKKAKEYMDNYIQYMEDYSAGDVLYFREYNLDGEEIDTCYGFVGSNSIEEIETCVGKFTKELGLFNDIDECLESLKIKEEER